MEKRLIQITSGKGPLECAWSAGKVYDLINFECLQNGFQLDLISKEKHQSGLEYSSFVVTIEGKQVMKFLDQWLGTIQVIAQSPYRKNHKRKNWFLAVFELLEKISQDIDINDIQFESIRCSGPGGQHVNKVSTGIRARHMGTGISVKTMESRSQSMNKKMAVEKIKHQLNKITAAQHAQIEQLHWKKQIEIERGQPKRIIYEKDFINLKMKR